MDNNNQNNSSEPAAPAPDLEISFWQSLKYDLKRKFSSRKLFHYEMCAGFNYNPDILKIRFYIPRNPVCVDIIIPPDPSARLTRVTFFDEENNEIRCLGWKLIEEENRYTYRVYPTNICTIKNIDAEFVNFQVQYAYEVQVYTVSKEYPDLAMIDTVTKHMESGTHTFALDEAFEYEKLADKSPYIQNLMAQIYSKLDNEVMSLEYILKSMVNGLDEEGMRMYREMTDKMPYLSDEDLESLKERAATWSIPSHYGIIVLLKKMQCLFGLDGWYLKKQCEVLRIKRPVAARMLTNLEFNFSNKEQLIYTNCRIIPQNGQIKKLASERFVVGDSTERNIYIATEEEKSGSWILPDLSVGDMVEFNFHLMCSENHPVEKAKPQTFLITPLAHEFHPTSQGSISVRFPEIYDMKCDIFNKPDNLKCDESSEDDRKTMTFELSEYIPERNIGFHYENYFRNPILACASSGNEWSDVAKSVLHYNLGDPELEDSLPEPLNQMLEGDQDPIKKLKKAFYWIRDKLKYAAIGSAIKHIGKAGRAQDIIESGVADCKAKSYLLYQVCKKLGLVSEFVAVSSKYGVIFDNLPSDQFDHVFIRVKDKERWLYLDAASTYSVFGSCPANFQGMKTLLLNSENAIETIAEEAPEKSKLIITETLDHIDSGWLSGTFHVQAEGNAARLIDENWKWHSLNIVDQIHSSQSILRRIMPAMLLVSCDRICNTSYSDIFEAVGTHRRCQLAAFENEKIGIIEWISPVLPMDYWRNISFDNFFVFYQPGIIEINLIAMDMLADQIKEISTVEPFENDICRIDETVSRDNDKFVISRKIVIKKKFVYKPEIHLMIPAMEQIEKSLQMAINQVN